MLGLVVIKSNCVSHPAMNIVAVFDVSRGVVCESSDLNRFVVASAYDIANGHLGYHVVCGECTDDGRWFFTALPLREYVALQCHRGCHYTSVQCFLLEWLAQFKCDFCILEGGRCSQSVCTVGVFD